MIDSIKENAVTDAYLRLFKILYLCGKVNPFMFRQKLQLPEPLLNSSSCTATNGKFFNLIN